METFYVWKVYPFRDLAGSANWRGLCDDSWYVFEQSNLIVTKTNHLFLDEVEDYVNKTYRSKSSERIRKQIITAAPRNLSSHPELMALDDGQSIQIEGLDFKGLLKRDILYVKSFQDKDVGPGENLYIDISYKKIINEPREEDRNRRNFLSELRKRTLAEYKSQFPGLEFRASIISYRTYNLNPACFRSFEELYEDYEREQEAAAYGNYLDSLYGL